MKKTCYSFEIEVITVKNGAISGREHFPYIAEASTYEKARTIAADYGQTIVRMRASQNSNCYYRIMRTN